MTLPYLERLSEQFRRTTNRHSFRVAFKPGRKIKRLNANFKSRLVKSKNAFYTGCLVRARILPVYAGEPWRLFQTGKKEHMDKVRVTNEDLHKGNTIARKTDNQRGWRPSMALYSVPPFQSEIQYEIVILSSFTLNDSLSFHDEISSSFLPCGHFTFSKLENRNNNVTLCQQSAKRRLHLQ